MARLLRLKVLKVTTAPPNPPDREADWTKLDLHIHTRDDPKDALDFSAHELLQRAGRLGFRVLAITLHDTVFDRPEVFRDADAMGILLIPSAEVRLCGADIVLLNCRKEEIDRLHDFDDLRALRQRRGPSLFVFAPHPFYVIGSSIGARLLEEIDCFDAIEWCHFHKGLFNPNRRAGRVARRFQKPLLATSDAHRLADFGSHYTSLPPLPKVTAASVFSALRAGPLRLTSPASSFADIIRTLHFIFVTHPLKKRARRGPFADHSPACSGLAGARRS